MIDTKRYQATIDTSFVQKYCVKHIAINMRISKYQCTEGLLPLSSNIKAPVKTVFLSLL